MLNIRFSLSSRRIRLDKLPWATFNTSNGSLVMAVFYFPLSLSLFVAPFYEAWTPIGDCSRGQNKTALYLLHSGFLSFSSLKRRFETIHRLLIFVKIEEIRRDEIFDNCSRFVLIGDLILRKKTKISGLILDSLLRRFSLQQWDFWNLILWCKFSIADFEFIEEIFLIFLWVFFL